MNEAKVALNTELHMDARKLKLAIFQAVMMWSDPHYERFLRRKKPGRLDEDMDKFHFDWFAWFLRDWVVARTIKKGKHEHESVRRYLDTEFRKRLLKGDEGTAVYEAARHIKDKGWSAGKDGKACLPLSLVSKIGFLLEPNHLVPYDTFARRGLGKWRGKRLAPASKINPYSDYLSAWDVEFKRAEKTIRNALRERWVRNLAKRLGCPIRALESPSLQRKVFDNHLMQIGGR